MVQVYNSQTSVPNRLLGILLKLRFLLSISGLGPELYISYKLLVRVSTAELLTTLSVVSVD